MNAPAVERRRVPGRPSALFDRFVACLAWGAAWGFCIAAVLAFLLAATLNSYGQGWFVLIAYGVMLALIGVAIAAIMGVTEWMK